MNIVELVGRNPSECLALSPQQQTFIIKYITSGRDGKYDALAATKGSIPAREERRRVDWATAPE